MGIKVIVVHKGFIWEEIAALLSGFPIELFETAPPSIEEIVRIHGEDVTSIITMHPHYYDPSLLDERICRFRSADSFVANCLGGNWGLFQDYDREGTKAYYACMSIGLLPLEERTKALRRICTGKRGSTPLFCQHAGRGESFVEKGKQVAHIVAEHSIFVASERCAIVSIGSGCDINLTHNALRTAHPSAALTAIHYYRKDATDPMKLLQKWSVRGAEDNEASVDAFMSKVCAQGNFGGSVGGITGVYSWYQASGTGHTSFEQYLAQL